MRPTHAIIAGGRPSQAEALERDGIRTFLHVPSPGLLRQFLQAGARRFVFEGAECGGHVGPRASFPLWAAPLAVLEDHFGNGSADGVAYAERLHDWGDLGGYELEGQWDAAAQRSVKTAVDDFATRTIVGEWVVPGNGSPDMGNLTADGKQLWLGGRYDGEVYVFDTEKGELINRIKVGQNPHGLTVWPQPGRFSFGHTGNMR